ncbi:MAG: hypothetical protein ACOC8F_00350 [Planctomycetota bacterium]
MHRLRIGSFLSLPMGVLLLILFFFPWVEVSCGVMHAKATVATANGWQLMLGEYSEVEYELEGGAKLADEMRVPAGASVDSRPKFVLALLASLGIVAVAVFGLMGKLPAEGAGYLLGLLGIIGIVITVMATFVSFDQEINRALQSPEYRARAGAPTTRPVSEDDAVREKISNVLRAAEELAHNKGVRALVRTGTTHYLWLSLVLYMIVAGTGAGMVLLGRPTQREARRRQALITPAPPERKELPREERTARDKREPTNREAPTDTEEPEQGGQDQPDDATEQE